MHRYTDEEVREILRRAIDSHEAERQGLTHEDLVAAASELGVEPGAVERAAIEVREQAAVDARRKERRRRERARFAGSVTTYAVVNAFLALLDWMTGGGWWVQWPLLIWGFFLVLQALSLLSPRAIEKRDARAERAYRRRLAREERRRAREEARRRRQHAEDGFEQAVERGVAALLSAAARSIDEFVPGAQPADRRDSEFQRYVRRQQHGTPAEEPAHPRARARVEPLDESPAEQEAEEPARRDSRASRRR